MRIDRKNSIESETKTDMKKAKATVDTKITSMKETATTNAKIFETVNVPA